MTISENEIDFLLSKATNQNSTDDTLFARWMDLHMDFWIWIYIGTVVFGGILLNMIVLYRILTARFNGTLSIISQIIFADIGILSVSTFELSYIYNNKWLFIPDLCPVYMGIDTFTSTSVIYFIVMINLHSISTHNLAKKSSVHEQKAIDCDDSTKSFIVEDDKYEVAVTEKSSTIKSRYKRSITIDYRPKKTRIAVILPTVYIWLVAASVSMPFFILADIFPSRSDPQICGILNFDIKNILLLQIFSIVIRLVVPCLCLLLTTAVSIKKLCFSSDNSKLEEEEEVEVEEDVNGNLRISVVLSLVFMVCCMQKLYGSLLFETVAPKPFMMPKYPIVEVQVAVLLAILNNLGSVIRPIVYLLMEKSIRIKIDCKNKIANVE